MYVMFVGLNESWDWNIKGYFNDLNLNKCAILKLISINEAIRC